jgi:hypothetical protein
MGDDDDKPVTVRRALRMEFWLLLVALAAACFGVPWLVVVPLTVAGLSIASLPSTSRCGLVCVRSVPNGKDGKRLRCRCPTTSPHQYRRLRGVSGIGLAVGRRIIAPAATIATSMGGDGPRPSPAYALPYYCAFMHIHAYIAA